MTRSTPLVASVLTILLAACSDAPADNTPSTPGVATASVIEGTIHLLSFYDLQANAEGIPCRDDDPVPLAAAAIVRRDLAQQGGSVSLVVIGDTIVDPVIALRGRPSRSAGRARALIIMDAMVEAGVDVWVPGHNDIELFGADVLFAEAAGRGLTVLLSNVEVTGPGQVTPYVVVQDKSLRLALLGALAPKNGDGKLIKHEGLKLIQPKRRLKEVADGILQRGEADMVAVLSSMGNSNNHRVAEIASVHFVIGSAEPGLAADYVVRRTGAALMAHKPAGRELAQTTFRVVNGDWNMADMSPLWTLPPVLEEEARNMQIWKQRYGTTDPVELARLITPDNPMEFTDKYSLHHENLAFLKEYADYSGSMLAHHAVPFPVAGAEDAVVQLLDQQGPAMVSAIAALDSDPPAFDGDGRIALAADCARCHEAQFKHWSKTSHARSFDALTSMDRQFDGSCLPCHAAGFGQSGTGYKDPRLEAPFGGFTCWSCHAVNTLHYESRMGVVEPDNVPIRHRDGMLGSCLTCHGGRRSPGFDLSEAIEQVACPPMHAQEPPLIEAYQQALAAIERNRMSESFKPRHVYLEGRALVGLGRRDEGLALIRQYAQDAEGNTTRTVEIANFLDRHGDSEGAIALLKKHVEQHAGTAEAHVAYAYVLVHATDERARDPATAAAHLGVIAPFDPAASMDASELPFRKLQVEALFDSGRSREGRQLLIYLLSNFRESEPLQELADRYAGS